VLLGYGTNGHLVPWSERGLRYVLEEVGKKAGVHCHAHRFRHTAISAWVEAGTPIEVVADMAGHEDVNTTRLYFASSIRLRREALRRRRRMQG
jgi:integrase